MIAARTVLVILLVAVGCSKAPIQPAATEGDAVIPPKKSAETLAYEEQCKTEQASARAALVALEKKHGDRSITAVLEPFNDLLMAIDSGLGRAQLLRDVHPDESLRAAADDCEQKISKVQTDVNLSRPLFEAIAAVDRSGADAVTLRYIERVLRDFRRAGVDKDEATRERIRVLRDELVIVGQQFNKNIREDVRHIEVSSAELAGLPRDYIEGHKSGPNGRTTISTDYPDYVPFITYAKDDGARLQLYREFRKRGYPQNVPVLQQMLTKRWELARLLGYESWATYITEDKMIKTASAAREFIDKVTELSKGRAASDYAELLEALRRTEPNAAEVGDWQKAYVEEQVKREKYDFDSQQLRPYLPFERVKQGVLDTTARMFGVSFVKIDAPVWHPSVEAYEMRLDGEVLGKFYLDMHPREGKYKHAAAFPIRSGVKGRRVPEAALVCNFPGGDGSEGLMEHSDVETFFHEFGHLLHHVLGGRQRWVGLSGFATEWDFVEVPSQVLEEWVWDGTVLNTFARNAAGESIPDELISRMRRSREFGKGLFARHQMFYAALSLSYYDRDPTSFEPTALMKEIQARYSPYKYVDDTYFHYSFGHLEGYSAIYYTYMWSLVIAKDLFSVFEKGGLLDPALATRYRQNILEPGGSQDATDMIRAFLGRDYSFASYAHWLNGR